MRDNLKQHFEHIYKTQQWVLDPGKPGSKDTYCEPYVSWVLSYLESLQPELIVDYGCGDTAMWPKDTWHSSYLGIDVSDTALEAASLRQPQASFTNQLDVPQCDVLMIKDNMIHWYDAEIQEWLDQNMRKAKTLIVVERDISNPHEEQFVQIDRDQHVRDWGYCPIDMSKFAKDYATLEIEKFLACVMIFENN